MVPGRSGRSLQERAAESGIGPAVPRSEGFRRPAPDPAASSPRPGEGGEGRHCWVRDPPEAPGVWPGLLVEWRQLPEGWQGRVVYTVIGPRGPALVEAWLPARWLEPR
jgi:hypothetical protein